MFLRCRALEILSIADPVAKVAATHRLFDESNNGSALGADDKPAVPRSVLPGRPRLPRLVSATAVPQRSPFTLAGRAALLHAVTHIEFNAINLALDAIWRFADMPELYYSDWLRVASEEALHFKLLNEHLQSLGYTYGDFDAHDGLWSMVEKTRHDIVARMALVPRTLEARGLDATPPMQAKFRKAGDLRAVAILDIILRDEIGHVEIGNRWYRWLCGQQGLDPLTHYETLLMQYEAPRPRPPFNVEARSAAGFTCEEIAELERGHRPRSEVGQKV